FCAGPCATECAAGCRALAGARHDECTHYCDHDAPDLMLDACDSQCDSTCDSICNYQGCESCFKYFSISSDPNAPVSTSSDPTCSATEDLVALVNVAMVPIGFAGDLIVCGLTGFAGAFVDGVQCLASVTVCLGGWICESDCDTDTTEDWAACNLKW